MRQLLSTMVFQGLERAMGLLLLRHWPSSPEACRPRFPPPLRRSSGRLQARQIEKTDAFCASFCILNRFN